MSRVQASFRFCARISNMNHPLTRPPATLSPIGGEGRGEGAGSWEGGTSKIWTRIGAMNQIGTPLPAISPQGGERVAEGRERGGSWRGQGAGSRFVFRGRRFVGRMF